MNSDLRNFLLLLFLALCWAPSFLFIKISIDYFEPITLTAIRVGIGALVLWGVLIFKRVKMPKISKNWHHLIACALLQSAIPFSLFGIAEKSVSSSLAAIICGAAPLLTLVLAHFVIENDKFSKAKIIGSFVGFFGLIILIFPSLFGAKATFIGTILLLVAAACYSVAFIYVKKFINLRSFPSLSLPFYQLLFSFVLLVPFALIFESQEQIKYASNVALIAVFGLSFFGTAIAFIVYYKLIDLTSATYTSIVNYMVPVFGAALGIAILGEEMTWNTYLGCILILLGVMISNKMIRIRKSKMNQINQI